jgi:hypothetical protein
VRPTIPFVRAAALTAAFAIAMGAAPAAAQNYDEGESQATITQTLSWTATEWVRIETPEFSWDLGPIPIGGEDTWETTLSIESMGYGELTVTVQATVPANHSVTVEATHSDFGSTGPVLIDGNPSVLISTFSGSLEDIQLVYTISVGEEAGAGLHDVDVTLTLTGQIL